MSQKEFTKAYKQLNNAQKEAVDAIEGPVMVIAGPGTGKTKILTLRIANILHKTDTAPENILALTFTESGVYSMRKNLVDIIGSAAYRVNIATFHGFCNEIIQTYPDEFKDVAGGSHIGPVEQIKILEDIITTTSFRVLKATANPHFYLYPALRKIGELKKDNISPQAFKKHLVERKKSLLSKKDHYHNKGKQKGKLKGAYERELRGIERSEEFLKIYKKYEDHLKKEHLYDYDDMIIEVINTLKVNKDFLLELEENYQYILADEHQDANLAQNTILELLSSYHAPYPNLFIVGDEKQAIFRFQGASLENFNYFRKLYPKARLITLTVNYRSTQTILDASGSLIKKGTVYDKELRRRLVSYLDNVGSPIAIYQAKKEEDEVYFVAGTVLGLIKKGVSPGAIAILYRDNKDAFMYSDLFDKKKIPFTVLSDTNILDDIEIRKLVDLFSAIENFGDDTHIARLFHYDLWKIDSLDIYKVLTYSQKEKYSIYDCIQNKKHLRSAGVKNQESFLKLYEMLSLWKRVSKNESFSVFFERVIQESGFMEHVLTHQDAKEKLENIERLYKEAADEAGRHTRYTLADFLRHIDLISKYNITLGSRDKALYQNTVQLMTAHRAKGLEFDYVFIVGVNDGHWGNKRKRDFFPVTYFPKDEDTIDDERRLFYVALTRAKKEAIITYSKENDDGKHLLPSQFIEEIDKEYIEETEVPKEKEAKIKEKRFLLRKESTKVTLNEKEYLNELFNERGLSVTALNNYLKCPWRFFYVNLIRVPELETPAQMYGTAMHEAMRRFFRERKKGKTATENKLITFFKESLSRTPLGGEVLASYTTKGEEALRGYYRTYNKEWIDDSVEEFPIRGVIVEPNIRLRGVIDRMVFRDDVGVSVIDYKTGRPRTRNYILGKTKDSTGDYKRQLVFYKLLLDLYDNGKFVMKEGVIDFLEPDGKGKYRKETFEISKEEVYELEKTIQSTAQEIRELSFWNTTCDEKECGYCALRFTKEKQ